MSADNDVHSKDPIADHQANALHDAGIGTWYLNLRTGRIDGSRFVRELLGEPITSAFSWRQFLGRVHRDDRVVTRQLRGLQPTDQVDGIEIDFRIQTAFRYFVWVRVFAHIGFNDSEGLYFSGTAQEISARKIRERSQSRYANYLNTMARVHGALASGSLIEDGLNQVLVVIRQEFKADQCILSCHDKLNPEHLDIECHSDSDAIDLGSLSDPAVPRYVTAVAKARTAHAACPGGTDVAPFWQRRNVQSELALVVDTDRNKRWVLAVQDNQKPRQWTTNEKNVLRDIGQGIGWLLARQRAERERVNSQQRLESIIRALPDPVFLLDRAGICRQRYLPSGHHFALAHGIATGEPIMARMDRESAQRAKWVLDTVALTDLPMSCEYKIRIEDTEHWFHANAAPHFDGQVSSVLWVARDITDQRRHDEQLRHSQKLESLGILAGGIAHDFNNLLAGISGNVELCMMDLSPDMEMHAPLSDVAMCAQRAHRLCERLLAYSGRTQPHFADINLNSLVTEMANLAALPTTKRSTLKFDLDPNLPQLHADGAQLEQVAMNLIMNAAESIPEGGGTVKVSTAVQHLTTAELKEMVSSEHLSPGHFVCLQVTDEGSGMDEATLSRIFDPFFTTKFTGRGLGLAAVLGIIQGHGGGLKVTSEPGKGSQFQVFFPLPDHPSEPGKQTDHVSTHHEAVPSGGHGLIVEDETPVRALCIRMLQRLGFRATGASDGIEGNACLAQGLDRFDFALIDLTMPGIDGLQLYRTIRDQCAEFPVLLMSGYSENPASKVIQNDQYAAFLSKPFTSDQFSTKLSQVLSTEAPMLSSR